MLPLSPAQTIKYAYRIKTRHGLLVDRLIIHGRDEADADRKLRRMYLHCEIVERAELDAVPRISSTSFEEIIALVSE
jgi:hypothetical protein